jgi:small subunit ribosomal protein S9
MAEVQLQQTQQPAPTPGPAAQAEIKEEKPKRAPAKRRSVKKVDKTIIVKSKRKTTVARAYVKSGKGRIRINGKDINALEFDAAKDLMMEPIAISSFAKEQIKKLDISINVYGGGTSSQIQAIRGALAKSLVEATKSEALKNEYIEYDRTLIVDDTRRTEPKKFKGPKARARFQTSYR